jgi:hypothetical protein
MKLKAHVMKPSKALISIGLLGHELVLPASFDRGGIFWHAPAAIR